MSASDFFLAYEAVPDLELTAQIDAALSEFSSIDLTLVKLTVGSVTLTWLLVSLGSSRDLVLWKMKYHLRKAHFLGPSSPMTRIRNQTEALRHRSSTLEMDPCNDLAVTSVLAALEAAICGCRNAMPAQAQSSAFRPVPDR